MDNGVYMIKPGMSDEEIAVLVPQIMRDFVDYLATPKERYFLHHAKRWRVRKKYRNRVLRTTWQRVARKAKEARMAQEAS